MPRRAVKPILIPISSFETIAERTKSANKRQSKPPKRFEFEYQYFPKLTIKREIYSNESDQYSSQYSYNEELRSSTSHLKRRRGRRRKSEVIGRVKHEMTSSSRFGLNPQIGLIDDNSNDLNPNRFNIFGANVSTSTPKTKQFVDKRFEYSMPSIPRIVLNCNNTSISSSPPQLTPIDESETEVDSDGLEEVPPPPTLEPVYQPVLQTVYPSNDFPENTYSNYLYIKKQKKSSNENQINAKSLLEFELNKSNRELDQIRKKYAQNVAELQTHREDKIRLKDNIKKLKEENSGLKRRIFEDNNHHKSEVLEVKRKHWCSVCLREGQYYCCWVGSYCSPECQKVHWEQSHKELCRRHFN